MDITNIYTIMLAKIGTPNQILLAQDQVLFLYTQTHLQTDAFTHKRLYTQTFHTQKLLHTEAFTQRSFYTQTLSHTETGPVKSPFLPQFFMSNVHFVRKGCD